MNVCNQEGFFLHAKSFAAIKINILILIKKINILTQNGLRFDEDRRNYMFFPSLLAFPSLSALGDVLFISV